MVHPGNPRPESPAQPSNTPAKAPKHVFSTLVDGWGSKPGLPAFATGFLLPLAALMAEVLFNMCGPVFFDPIPSSLHTALVAAVPLANLAVFLALRFRRLDRAPLLLFLNGFAVGVGGFYAVLFLPLLPIGAAALLFFGLGLLILAPALGFWSSLALRRHLANNLIKRPRGFAYGLGAALLLLAGSEIRATLTKVGVDQAISMDGDERRRGVRLLRAVGNRDLLLRYCYGLPGRATDVVGSFLSMGRGLSTDEARALYWRVYGEHFNERPAPVRDPQGRGLLDWGFRFDGDQGGESVGGVLPGLSMASSNLEATIDAGAALSYQEWTLEFVNRSDDQAEARAQIRLPPDGVVSRLTLWVDGEEREAAFAGRGRVREAYQKVVRARRDPVLVTTVGKDRVLMQCFPVPSKGGRMKVRLGITAPLAFTRNGEGHFHLPAFSERNFDVTGSAWSGAVHAITLTSDQPFPSAEDGWSAGTGEGGKRWLGGQDGQDMERHVRKGRWSDAWLSEGRSLAVGEARGGRTAWAEDPRLGGDIVQQWAETARTEPLGDLYVVVDGSRGMEPFRKDIAAALRRAERPIHLFLAAAEEVRDYQGPAQRAGDWLERQPFVGGQDNIPALLRAWERAPDAQEAAVLWIHAGQPLFLDNPEALRHGLERQRKGPRILSLQVGPGPDRILEAFADLAMVESLRWSGSLREELAARVSPVPTPRLNLKRKRVPAAEGHGRGVKASNHLARLLVHDEIKSQLASSEPLAHDKAAAAAGLFQLVTPASGAVVLENASQYAEAGLHPADPATVPGVPEPGTVALLIAAALLLGASTLKSRLRRKPA